jgi:hypothetical protein
VQVDALDDGTLGMLGWNTRQSRTSKMVSPMVGVRGG